MKQNQAVFSTFLTISILLSGLLAPLNFMFYSRFVFEPMNVLDYIVLITGFLVLMFLCHLLVRHLIASMVFGWGIQIIGNLLLSMALSINPEDLSSSIKFDFILFGIPFTFAAITLPLMLYLFSGLLLLGCGLQYLSTDKNYRNKMPSNQRMHIIGSLALGFTINGVFLLMDKTSTYNLFLISPLSAIIGIFSLLIVIKDNSAKYNIRNEQKIDHATLESVSSPSSIIKLISKGIILFVISALSLLLIGFSNLAYYSNSIVQYRQIDFASSMLLAALVFVIFLGLKNLIQKKIKLGALSKILRLFTTDLFILSLIAVLLINLLALNAFNPDLEFNAIFQLFGNAILMSSLLYLAIRILLEKTDIPASFGLIYGLFLYASGYLSRIPLKTDEMWNQWDVYGLILIVIAVVFPVFVLILTTFSNRHMQNLAPEAKE